MIEFYIVTLFPDYFSSLIENGIIGSLLRGEKGVEFKIHFINPRDYCSSNYKGVDDSPYGGGPGMVMRADVLQRALLEGAGYEKGKYHVIYTGPRGKTWNDKLAREFALEHFVRDSTKKLVFVCGRYEGIDERFIQAYVDEQISIGDFILSGGEPAVNIILDSALRFVPGALGNKNSTSSESFSTNLLEHPHYTRPQEFEGQKVPAVLLSGNHKDIFEYREKESMRLTQIYRSDLLKRDDQ